ncbi:hypothetical protein AK812_SmicGene9313 [Symbiodinium microadriaticum]|uniref:Uncharacterized protein n=1 Tax=Symbiodinium microadriaticum TaxID=2951 RepID=A0A1Q9EIL5_SYMMI|nr:hypothetical protein AK812_SmicGene9313 [Symbiodinium microadriaticum]CAE7815644.1 unnamed protein product [Symbiodinium sp. KB8]CAE7902866.1 unnamed protein product [Symbiodinium microadriaticum]
MAWMLDEWEPRLRRRKRKSRRPVSYKWLKEPVPDPDLVAETEKALKVVADASLEECLEELASIRQDDAHVAGSPQKKLEKQWSSLLSRARGQVLSSVEKEFGPSSMLQPIHPSSEVKNEFFTARRTFECTTTFTYHGTKSANIDSISRVGLLMPGKNGHKVANGSAHGVGIYTAQLGKATLSKTFCDSNKMFVCAVCDTSQPLAEEEAGSKLDTKWKPSATVVQSHFPNTATAVNIHPSVRRLGRHNVQRSSDQVIHVGDAVVTFEQRCVVPLFLLSWSPESQTETEPSAQTQPTPFVPDERLMLKHHCWDVREQPWALPQQVGRRRLAVPETDADRLIKFGNVWDLENPRRGRTVWMVSHPFKGRTKSEIRMKRRVVQRQSDIRRRRARQWHKENDEERGYETDLNDDERGYEADFE